MHPAFALALVLAPRARAEPVPPIYVEANTPAVSGESFGPKRAYPLVCIELPLGIWGKPSSFRVRGGCCVYFDTEHCVGSPKSAKLCCDPDCEYIAGGRKLVLLLGAQ